MFELLLYASIACQDTTDMISRIRANDSVSEIIQTEVIETLKEATPHCKWDAND
jgi:hypothetical protein